MAVLRAFGVRAVTIRGSLEFYVASCGRGSSRFVRAMQLLHAAGARVAIRWHPNYLGVVIVPCIAFLAAHFCGAHLLR